MLIAFHKPYGVISRFTSDGSANRTLSEFGFPKNVYPIGRLDAESEGLLLLSDGITDAFNPAGEAYGNARLETALDAVRGRSAGETVAHMLADSARFAAGAEAFDDTTCLALFYRREQALDHC